MFIKKFVTRKNNHTHKKLIFNWNNWDYLHFITKNSNNKFSWYRKKKVKNCKFIYESTPNTEPYYLVLSKFCIDNGRKWFDLRVNLYGVLYYTKSSWGTFYKQKIRTILPKFNVWVKYENIFSQWVNSLEYHKSRVFHHVILKHAILATSPGTYIRLLSKKKSGLYTFLLPSGKKIKTFLFQQGFTGRNEGIFFNNQNFYKAGNFQMSKKHVIVRGIAKNPVDHPNGGRSNTKGSFKTPWGKIAKHNK